MEDQAVASVGLAPFAEKHFPTQGNRNAMIKAPIEEFLAFVNSAIAQGKTLEKKSSMDFCRYVFIPNFTQAQPSHVRIDNTNAQWLRSAYKAREERELPVLERWFSFPVPLEPSRFLMFILYSREQLEKEAKASGSPVPDADWSIISIMGLNETEVPPMPPITIMRNALGINEGGNGVPLDKAKYAEAVAYWQNFAMVK